ncbi:hypothetical protein HK405_010574, partial [Cladochytrium tenue]
IVLNPASPLYAQLEAASAEEYEDAMWSEDAIFLERNSRSFVSRIHTINENANVLADFLKSHPKVKDVYYPKFTTPDIYERYLTPSPSVQLATAPSSTAAPATAAAPSSPQPRYGGLLSVVLHGGQPAAARFFDRLRVAKGPSLGTNFTLACPFTLLAHYGELDWAERFGVDRNLVRVSVGLEDAGTLVHVFAEALDAV